MNKIKCKGIPVSERDKGDYNNLHVHMLIGTNTDMTYKEVKYGMGNVSVGDYQPIYDNEERDDDGYAVGFIKGAAKTIIIPKNIKIIITGISQYFFFSSKNSNTSIILICCCCRHRFSSSSICLSCLYYLCKASFFFNCNLNFFLSVSRCCYK